jgi:hypothetical protein
VIADGLSPAQLGCRATGRLSAAKTSLDAGFIIRYKADLLQFARTGVRSMAQKVIPRESSKPHDFRLGGSPRVAPRAGALPKASPVTDAAALRRYHQALLWKLRRGELQRQDIEPADLAAVDELAAQDDRLLKAALRKGASRAGLASILSGMGTWMSALPRGPVFNACTNALIRQPTTLKVGLAIAGTSLLIAGVLALVWSLTRWFS